METISSKFRFVVIFLGLVLIVGISGRTADRQHAKYMNPRVPVEERVDDLLRRMTLKEKIGQMHQIVWSWDDKLDNMTNRLNSLNGNLGSLVCLVSDPILRNTIQKLVTERNRFKIPVIFGFDVIHGFRTIYPIPLAQSCSWNLELVRRACAMSAEEAANAGLDWTYAPMIDVSRDPRWGRVAECFGEDPYVNSVFAVASVQGFQGENLAARNTIAACLKHYVGYSESEGGRDYSYADVSTRTLQEVYLPPYKAGVQAGVCTLMSAFNDLSGIPATANHYLLTEVLRGQWGFDGFVLSDWEAVKQLVTQGYAEDDADAAEKAIEAGVDMDLRDGFYFNHLENLVNEGRVSVETVDEAVHRILRVKFRLGLFERPYVEEVPEKERILKKDYLAIAKELAAESVVLLKNENKVLPINKKVKSLAVIGPLASNKQDLLGSWRGRGKAEDVISILEGIKERAGETCQVHHAIGCAIDDVNKDGFSEAVRAAQVSDVVLLCLGENARMSGENASRSSIELPGVQEELLAVISKTNKPIVLLLSNGRPIDLNRIEPKVAAILEVWQPGIQGGPAVAEILFGDRNPSGKLSITFPRTTGQIPIYYNHRSSSRPKKGRYQDIPTEPMYWFGHGLSYVRFEYGQIKLSRDTISRNEELIAQVTVTNTGERKGKETVLWYIRDHVGRITRPVKELKYFEKREILPGQNYTFRFTINPKRDLSYPDDNGHPILEEGRFSVWTGNQKAASFTLSD